MSTTASTHQQEQQQESQQNQKQKIQPSANEDAENLVKEATALLITAGEGVDGAEGKGKWRLTEDGKGLEREFRFRTFGVTWDFMNKVAAECKVQKHHPEWSNVYNKTQIRWTTHRPSGLSSKDVHMARFCDKVGEECGEVV